MIGVLIIVWCILGAYSNAANNDKDTAIFCVLLAVMVALFKTVVWLHEDLDGKED